MPPFHRIEELPPLVGQSVLTRGWVMTTRSSGKIGFVTLRDGTGYLQVVLSKKDVPEAAWEAFGRLTQETSAEVTGTVRADARAPGGVELTATDLRVIGPSHDFPITPKEHGTAFLFEHRHLWLRSHRWRCSNRKAVPCSLGVIGKSTLGPMIFRSDAVSSTPPGARASARTVPLTSSEVSWVRRPNASHAASGTSFFDSTTCK